MCFCVNLLILWTLKHSFREGESVSRLPAIVETLYDKTFYIILPFDFRCISVCFGVNSLI